MDLYIIQATAIQQLVSASPLLNYIKFKEAKGLI